MNETEFKLDCELVKNSRRSDRELAKSLDISQPTVSRIRKRLERQGIIHYTGSPDLKELGFEIIGITFGNLKLDSHSDVDARVQGVKISCGNAPTSFSFPLEEASVQTG